MSNVFTFGYESEYHEEDEGSSFPHSTRLDARHEFVDGQTWHAILWQFCHFLESTGFEGVRKSVKIDGYRGDWLFDAYYGEPTPFSEDLEEYIEALDKTDKDAQ